LAGVTSPTLEAFAAAVARELADLRASGGRRGPEAPLRPPPLPGLEPVPRADERPLEPLLRRVAERGSKLLPPSLKANLGGAALPPIAWTRRVNASTFGMWTLELRRRNRRGERAIRINRVLLAPPEVISDALLEFLIWHELLHHLLPGQGHDAQFRHLESLWPDAPALDHELDTLHERFDLRPERY
jgi:hypothetical protein